MVVTMQARLSQQAMRQGKTLDQETFNENNSDLYDTNANANSNDKFRFSFGQLPLWAKKHISNDNTPPASLTKAVPAPKGRWAQRVETGSGVKSFYSDFVIPFPNAQNSEGFKDSSLESSELETPIEESFNEFGKEILQSSSKIMLTRGDNDLESNAHDADIDSDQEYRHQPLYYPTHVDSASGSEYTVTNIDQDELRRSVRKSKRSNLPSISTTTGSQDSDDDDDEASTPSGENTDRNPLSMLSESSESLDQFANREKYLQSTFESLSGAEMDSATNKSSISSQYHTRKSMSPQLRNMAVINAAKQTKNNAETAKKREELKKRIADTKKKLENIGYSNPLRNSQSIMDLSYIPEKDGKRSMKAGNTSTDCPCSNTQLNKNDSIPTNNLFDDNSCSGPRNSSSVPADLQLCGCYMREITKNTSDINNFSFLRPSKLSDILSQSPEKGVQDLAALINPRKLKLDKTLNKYKMHKSLPVSPVSEECRLADFATAVKQESQKSRKSFSYFVDLNEENNTDEGFRKICDDIEKFSQDFSRNYQQIEDIFREKTDNECFVNRGQGFVKSRSDFGFLTETPAIQIEKSQSDYTVGDSGYVNEAFVYSNYDSLEPTTKVTSKKKIHRELSGKKAENWLKHQNGEEINYDKNVADYENVQFYEGEEEEGNFSSDSLEDCSFKSVRNSKLKRSIPPRRCVSNNELYKLQAEEVPTDYSKYFHDCDIPKSESFYLNQSNKNSQESILSSEDFLEDDGVYRKSRSYCNSLESILSNESDCKSAPLEILFASHRSSYSQSLPKSRTHHSQLTEYLSKSCEQTEIRRSHSMYNPERPKVSLRTSQTQTDFDYETPKEKVAKKPNTSSDFQQKLLKFESRIAQNDLKSNLKPVAFFVRTDNKKNNSKKENVMYIPSLESKNQQYKSKFCNVLNNKPETNLEIFQTTCSKKIENVITLSKHNFSKSNKNNETSSLDRYLLSKGLLETEKVCHKPPKAIRRHSSKTRKKKTSYEYVKKEELTKAPKLNNAKCSSDENQPPQKPSNESSIEFSYKEKNLERDLENSNLITELYDSLDKRVIHSRMETDSLEYNVNLDKPKMIEAEPKQLWNVQMTIDNIKILNEIQNKISVINNLVEVFKKNLSYGKVKTLSSMYENMSRPQIPYRKRNLSLPNFQEFERNKIEHPNNKIKKNAENCLAKESHEVRIDDNQDSSLRRACSLSDLSVQGPVAPKRKIEQVSGKVPPKNAQVSRISRQNKSAPMMRSRSTGVLNQSDSDDNEKKLQSRLMRPTISSQNKVAGNSKNVTMRKRHHSVLNLSAAQHEDSSSEEMEKPLPSKPVVPPRTRMLDSEVYKRRLAKEKESREALNLEGTSQNFEDGMDTSTFERYKEIYDEAALELTKSANNVVQLCRKLTDPNDRTSQEFPSQQKTDTLKNLELSIVTTLRLILDYSLEKCRQNSSIIDVNQTDTVKKLIDMTSKGLPNDQNTVINIMQQYCDILLGMMQQIMQNSNN